MIILFPLIFLYVVGVLVVADETNLLLPSLRWPMILAWLLLEDVIIEIKSKAPAVEGKKESE